MPDVVISAAAQVLAHVPSLARHGSKPRRELPKNAEVAEKFAASLRTFDQAPEAGGPGGRLSHEAGDGEAGAGGERERQHPERERGTAEAHGALLPRTRTEGGSGLEERLVLRL